MLTTASSGTADLVAFLAENFPTVPRESIQDLLTAGLPYDEVVDQLLSTQAEGISRPVEHEFRRIACVEYLCGEYGLSSERAEAILQRCEWDLNRAAAVAAAAAATGGSPATTATATGTMATAGEGPTARPSAVSTTTRSSSGSSPTFPATDTSDSHARMQEAVARITAAQHVSELFPELSPTVIEDALQQCRYDLARTVEVLLAMKQHAPLKKSATATATAAQRRPPQDRAEDGASRRDLFHLP